MPKKNATTLERDDVPRMTISITDEAIWLTRHDRSGAPAATYPVSAGSVANAFNMFGASTGLLSAETLFWQSRGGVMRLGVWIAPGKHTLNIRTGKRLDVWTVPLPGMVFVGNGTRYHIFAAAQRPARKSDPVFHCPLPNVYEDGSICAGNVPFPKCEAGTIAQSLSLFFESEFNHDLAGQHTLALLVSLRGKRAFPLAELHRWATIGEIMNDGQSNGRRAGLADVWEPHEEPFELDPYEYAYGETENDDEDL